MCSEILTKNRKKEQEKKREKSLDKITKKCRVGQNTAEGKEKIKKIRENTFKNLVSSCEIFIFEGIISLLNLPILVNFGTD